MATCSSTAITPGTPTNSSGYTERLAQQAVDCDRARILARLQGGVSGCLPEPTGGRGAVYASILELDAARGCPVPQTVETFKYPRVGVPESVRIQRVIQDVTLCATNPLNPTTRFSEYARVFPAPCPVTPMNTTPKPTFRPGCTPSRFF